MVVSSVVIALAATLIVTHCQFLSPPQGLTEVKGAFNTTVRYKQVSYNTCETTPGVRSYSGYVDVAEHRHVFWWFFEARNGDPTAAPLTVWLNGGPGASSMQGALLENGPCRLDAEGNPHYNPYSWSNVSNMLYIDQPIDVGFSYSDPVPAYQRVSNPWGQTSLVGLSNTSCPDYLSEEEARTCGTWSDYSLKHTSNSTNNAKRDLWMTLQGFVGAFPQYSHRQGFHIACESFGGHYCPIYADYILQQNSLVQHNKLPGAQEIDLKAVLVGNGWFDGRVQYPADYNFTVSPGNTYNVQIWNKKFEEAYYDLIWGPGNCVEQLQQCYQTGRDDVCSAADSWCFDIVENEGGTDRDWYNLRQPSSANKPPRAATNIYLNRPEIQEALGVAVNFTWLSYIVENTAFPNTGSDIARTEGVIELMRKLADAGVYVVQYHGDADISCNWFGGEAVMREIDAPGIATAGYENITTTENTTIYGQVKQSANYAFVRVYESGHEVPYWQPRFALEMLNRTLQGVDLAAGTIAVAKGSGYSTVGPPTSDFREGNATVRFVGGN